MKTLWIALASILALVTSAYAHMETSSVEDMMGSMMAEQNASELGQLDCSKIPDSEFEELGDATMERMVGGSELHEQMDTMMGGEGSASLTQMHIIMGKNWLSCTSLQGMMGSNMMPMMMRMMGNYYPSYYTGYNAALIFAILGWGLAAVLIVILVLILTGNIKIKKRK
ncbi:MAG: hypothetical protein HYS62_01350 [Candidatus Aenigmarchaeota archaeon]|nr:hypothetical protein [Candidatus Aenigmarchaeota archaeon]